MQNLENTESNGNEEQVPRRTRQTSAVTEIHFTDEQAKAIEKAVRREIKGKKSFKQCFVDSLNKIANAFVVLIVGVLTLKNTGKWISVLTISFILGLITKFLYLHSFSMAAMTLVMPHLGQIAIVVFSVIGGFKGAKSIVERLKGTNTMVSTVNEITQGLNQRNNEEEPTAQNSNSQTVQRRNNQRGQ